MSLRVSGKNMNIGEALREHVTTRLSHATAKYVDGNISGHVTIAPEGSGFRADCTVHLSSGTTLQSDGRAQEPYACFEQAAERLEGRLRRYKGRLKQHHQGHGDDAADNAVASYVIEAPDDSHDAPAGTEFSPVIIAETSGRMARMTVAAAVVELDLTGAAVLPFRHAGSDRVNFVYRRPDGNIGWVDPASDAAAKGRN